MPFQPVKSRRVFEEVADQVRKHIAAHNLRPGDKLPPERDLADQLGISRNGVREALRALEIAGVISLKPGLHGGAYISHGDPSHVSRSLRDQFSLGALTLETVTEARRWICPMVVRAVCERATEADLAAMEENVALADHLYHDGEWDQKIVVQVDFHNLLARATKNPVIEILMESLSGITLELARRIGPEKCRDSIKSRYRLLAHIRERNAEAAAQEIDNHLRELQKRYLAVMAADPERFGGPATPGDDANDNNSDWHEEAPGQ